MRELSNRQCANLAFREYVKWRDENQTVEGFGRERVPSFPDDFMAAFTMGAMAAAANIHAAILLGRPEGFPSLTTDNSPPTTSHTGASHENHGPG